MPKFRVSANLVWDVEETDIKIAEEKAMKQLLDMAQSAGTRLRKPRISINQLKELNCCTTVLATFQPDEILNIITKDGHRKEFKIGEKAYRVKLNSDRYFTFQKNRKCVACGIEGSKMLLELPNGSEFPHFNLYAEENGNDVLMTKDHKIPSALGGRDEEENYQTMCAICNNIKGKDILLPEDIKILREIYDDGIRNHLTSSHLYQKLQESKQDIIGCRPREPVKKQIRLALVSLICFITIIIAVFDPFYSIVGLCMSILGYTAGTIK